MELTESVTEMEVTAGRVVVAEGVQELVGTAPIEGPFLGHVVHLPLQDLRGQVGTAGRQATEVGIRQLRERIADCLLQHRGRRGCSKLHAADDP